MVRARSGFVTAERDGYFLFPPANRRVHSSLMDLGIELAGSVGKSKILPGVTPASLSLVGSPHASAGLVS